MPDWIVAIPVAVVASMAASLAVWAWLAKRSERLADDPGVWISECGNPDCPWCGR